MTNLPNPWLTDSTPRSAEAPAASSPSTPLRDAAGGPFQSALAPAMAADTAIAPELTDPPVAVAVEFVDLDAIDCIGEIFVGAQRLEPCERPEPTILELMARGFNLEAFMSDCEPGPMFLQRSA